MGSVVNDVKETFSGDKKVTTMFVSDVTPATKNACINVRIIHVWKLPDFSNPKEDGSIEMVLVDSEESLIGATVKKNCIAKFEPLISAGIIRQLSLFGVGVNDKGKYRATRHKCQLFFNMNTQLKIISEMDIPNLGFDFIPFVDIIEKKHNYDYLADVIGQIIGIGDLISSDNKPESQKRLAIELQDLEKRKLKMTLWNNDAIEVSNYAAKNKLVVLAANFIRCQEYNGQVSITPNKYYSKIYINSDLPPIKDFQVRLSEQVDFDEVIPKVAELKCNGGFKTIDDYIRNANFVKLEEMKYINQICHCSTVATIKEIVKENKDDWFYIACNYCNKKVQIQNSKEDEQLMTKKDESNAMLSKDFDHHWFCKNCHATIKAVTPRYKIQLYVVDSSGGGATVTMFDRDVYNLIHKTAYELRKQTAVGDEYPKALDELINKKLLLRLDVNDYNLKHNIHVYTVSRATEDVTLIEKFVEINNSKEKTPTNNEETQNISKTNDEPHYYSSSLLDTVKIKEEITSQGSQNNSKADDVSRYDPGPLSPTVEIKEESTSHGHKRKIADEQDRISKKIKYTELTYFI